MRGFSLFCEDENQDDFDDEMEFAARLINKEMSLEGFKYYKDYQDTVASEAKLVSGRVLFIGSGPVPLTAILLKRDHGVNVVGMEYDAVAARASQKLLEILGVDMQIIVADARKFTGYSGFDTIMVALEAGPTEQTKREIFSNIQSQISPSTLILIRGSNTTMFPGVEGYVGDYFTVKRKIPVFSNLSTSYLLSCGACPIGRKNAVQGMTKVGSAVGVRPGVGSIASVGKDPAQQGIRR